MDAGVPGRSVEDNARFDRGVSQFRLLWASPSVETGQHQLNVTRNGAASSLPIRHFSLEQFFYRLEEIVHEIREGVGGFSFRGFCARLILHRCRKLRRRVSTSAKFAACILHR